LPLKDASGVSLFGLASAAKLRIAGELKAMCFSAEVIGEELGIVALLIQLLKRFPIGFLAIRAHLDVHTAPFCA